jgi:hypothetical protein
MLFGTLSEIKRVRASMLLMIDQPQVRFTASRYTPQTRANAGDWGS